MDGGVCLQRKPLAAAKGSGPEGRGPGFWCCWGVAERGRGKTKVRGRSWGPGRPPAGPHLSHPSECWEYPPLLMTNRHSMTREASF